MQDLINGADDILRGIGFGTKSISSNYPRNLNQRIPARFFKEPSIANGISADYFKVFDPFKSQENEDFCNNGLSCSEEEYINSILEYLLAFQEDDEKIPVTNNLIEKNSIVINEDNRSENQINKDSDDSKLSRIHLLKESISEKFSDNQAFSFINNYLQNTLNKNSQNSETLENSENSKESIEHLNTIKTSGGSESTMHRSVNPHRHKKDVLKWSLSAPVHTYQQPSNQSVRPVLRQTPKGTYYWTILQPSNFSHLESNGYYDTMPSVKVPEYYNTPKVDSNNTLLNVKKLLVRLLQLSNVPINLIEQPDLHSKRIQKIPKRFFKKPSIDRQKDTLVRSYSESQLESNITTQSDINLKKHMPSNREKTLTNKSLLLESKCFDKNDSISFKVDQDTFRNNNTINGIHVDSVKHDSNVSESTSTADTPGWSISESSGSVARDYELEKYYSSKNLLKIPTNDMDDSSSCHSDRTATNENERFLTTFVSLDDAESGIYNNNNFNMLDSVEDVDVMPEDCTTHEQPTKKRPNMREIRSLKIRKNLEVSHNKKLTRQRSSQSDSSGYADGEFADSFSFFQTSQQERDKLSKIEDEVSNMPPIIVTESCSVRHTSLGGQTTEIQDFITDNGDHDVRSIFHFGNVDNAFELGKEIKLLVTPDNINVAPAHDDVFYNSEHEDDNNNNNNKNNNDSKMAKHENNARLCLKFKNLQYEECDYSINNKKSEITDNKSELNLIYKNKTYSCDAKNKSFSFDDRKLQNIRPRFYKYTGESIDFNNKLANEHNNSVINNNINNNNKNNNEIIPNIGYDLSDSIWESEKKPNDDSWFSANKNLTKRKSQDKKGLLTRQRSFTDEELN